jgi:hypothetical protein
VVLVAVQLSSMHPSGPAGGVSPADALLWSSPTKTATSRTFRSDDII